MIQVFTTEGGAGDKLIKKFLGYVKSKGLLSSVRLGRYWKQKKTKRIARKEAIMREFHRAENKRKQFIR